MSQASETRRSHQEVLSRARRARRERGAMSLTTLAKVLMGWSMFLGMSLFYAMLPIASIQLLPIIFFGCVCLLSSLYDDTGLSGDCK